ncbi:MAG: hypothetical protein HY926_01685 [Elusimicrobia bacterium]|nr:hypothetical protein [Elusimicrobiota bacterium]
MRSRALALALLVLAAPGQAAITRSGSLNWRFDDLTIDGPQGRLRRTQFYQGYDLAVGAPLLHKAVGSLDLSGKFEDGADLSQTVNANTTRKQVMGFRAAADLLRPELRDYVRLSPNYSQSTLRMVGAGRDITDRSWGFSSGLSLPRLPALSLSRQYSSLDDPLDLNPMHQSVTSGRESLSYSLGPARLMLDHDNRRTHDRQGIQPDTKTDQKRASFELNYYQMKALPLDSLSLRGDLFRYETNGSVSQEQASSNINLRTRQFQSGSWSHSLTYGNILQRDNLARDNELSQNATADSRRAVRRGSLLNTLGVNQTTGRTPSQGVQEGLNLSLAFASGTLTSETGVSGGWSRGAGSSFLNNGARGLLTFAPRRPYSVFTEARTEGTEALGGARGGSRTNRLGAGSTLRPSQYADATVRWDRTHQRDHAAASTSLSDQIDLLSRLYPIERLLLSAGYNLGFTKSEPGGSSRNRTMRLSLEYAFLFGLQVSGGATLVGDSYTANGSLNYSLGKTELFARYEHRELSTPSTYSYLSVGLKRSF